MRGIVPINPWIFFLFFGEGGEKEGGGGDDSITIEAVLEES